MLSPETFTDDDLEFNDMFRAYIVNFIKNGNPNEEGLV